MSRDASSALKEQLEEEGKLWKQNPQRLREVLAEGAVRAKIPTITPHALRHTFGTRWFQAGGDIYKLPKILGHSSVAVTEGPLRAFAEGRPCGRQPAGEDPDRSPDGRHMPRLSVDLDLVFTDHRAPRAEALAAINEALRAGRERLAKRGFKVQAVSAADMGETKLLVQRDDLSVKIEVNTVMRGTVHPTQTTALTAAASEALMADLELPLLSPEDIYGGKLVAAMDRQHPRDLFDAMELFAHGGITPDIRRAFVVYLASHTRTIHEVLFPTPKDITLTYDGSFVGMTTAPVTLQALLDTRERLFRELPAALDANEREFLRSLVRARPDWSLLGSPHAWVATKLVTAFLERCKSLENQHFESSPRCLGRRGLSRVSGCARVDPLSPD